MSDPKTSGKAGAPIGNVNGMKSGITLGRFSRGVARRERLDLGKLPPAFHRIERRAYAFRRLLEAAVLEVRGEIGVVDAAHIATAAKWERHSQLAARWLRMEAESMTHEMRLAYSREVAKASSERDRAIRELRIDARDMPTVLDVLYGAPAIDEPEDQPTDDDAAESKFGNEREG